MSETFRGETAHWEAEPLIWKEISKKNEESLEWLRNYVRKNLCKPGAQFDETRNLQAVNLAAILLNVWAELVICETTRTSTAALQKQLCDLARAIVGGVGPVEELPQQEQVADLLADVKHVAPASALFPEEHCDLNLCWAKDAKTGKRTCACRATQWAISPMSGKVFLPLCDVHAMDQTILPDWRRLPYRPYRCGCINIHGERCGRMATRWVGSKCSDYTLVCHEHVESAKRGEDTVHVNEDGWLEAHRSKRSFPPRSVSELDPPQIVGSANQPNAAPSAATVEKRLGDDGATYFCNISPLTVDLPLPAICEFGPIDLLAPFNYCGETEKMSSADFVAHLSNEILSAFGVSSEIFVVEECPQRHHEKDGPCDDLYCRCPCQRCRKQCEERR